MNEIIALQKYENEAQLAKRADSRLFGWLMVIML